MSKSQADNAQHLLNNEFFRGVVEKQQQGYIQFILNSGDTDIDLRERALIKYHAIAELVSSIESISKQKLIDEKRWKIF